MVRGDLKYDQKRTGSRQQALKLSHIEGRGGQPNEMSILQTARANRTDPQDGSLHVHLIPIALPVILTVRPA